MAKRDSLWLIESVNVMVLRLMGPFNFFSELFLSAQQPALSIGLEAVEGISLCPDILLPVGDGNS